MADLASRLRFAIARSARRMRQQAGNELTPTQLAALASIERAGPLTPSELAEIERVKRPTATRVATTLEERGLIDRADDPSDGRGSLLSVSVEGGRLLRRVRTRKDAYLAERLRGLDADDLDALERAATVLERMLDEDPS